MLPTRTGPAEAWSSLIRLTPRMKGCLFAVLSASFLLNVIGNRWGTPDVWHPDELTPIALEMLRTGDPNPHFFAYGVLPYYLVAGAAIVEAKALQPLDPAPAPASPDYAAWVDRNGSRLVQGARLVSALSASLLVGVTFLIGATLFGPRTGLLAAVMLAISSGLVAIAHWATVDSVATFAYWVACFCTLRLWTSGGRRWYAWTGLALGIAIGFKADRVAALVPLAVAHGWRGPDRRRSDLLVTGGLILLGFVCANPVILFATFEFVDGFTRELLYNAMRDAPGHTSYAVSIVEIAGSVGTPMFVVSAVGSTVAGLWLATTRPKVLLWLVATVCPYYVFVAAQTFPPWYAPLLLPAPLILTAHGVMMLIERGSRAMQAFALILIAAAAVVTFTRTVLVLDQFREETRNLASRWIENHIPAGSSIAVPYYPPRIRADVYDVLELPQERVPRQAPLEALDRLDSSVAYGRFRATLLRAREWLTGKRASEELYVAWFDRMADRVEHDRQLSSEGTLTADFLVLFPENNPELLAQLRRPGSAFSEVVTFDPAPPTLFRPRVEFVNPTVVIFRRGLQSGVPDD